MIHRVRGLWHVRRLWVAPVLTTAMVAAAWQFYDIGFRVQPVVEEVVRAVGAPEVFGALTAALLPALCLPTFNGRERLAGRGARWTHTTVSAVLLLAPLLVLYAWYQSVRWHVPSQALPPVHHFAGNFLLMASWGLLAALCVGPRLGPVTTVVAYAGLVMAQQAWPGSPIATQFSVGKHWATNWWLTAGCCLFALTVDHLLRSVPWRATRQD
jgi:hypothetical protein